MKNIIRSTANSYLLLSLVYLSIFILGVYSTGHAATLEDRNVEIGTSVASQNTSHKYQFTIGTSGNVGSIEFEYCTNNPLIGAPCTAPAGLDASGANITSQSGATGFSVHPLTTANRLIISRIPSSVTAPQVVLYNFSNIVNPSTQNQSVYVRISTYATNNASGSRVDAGAVVFAITRGLSVDGVVPPYLTFCAGVTVALNCTTATGTSLSFGELSRNEPRFLTSQFAGATNDESGYIVTLSGITMTSGSNTIAPLSPGGSSTAGSSQFGLNLVSNTSPLVGQAVIGIGSAAPAAGYGTTNQFKFANEVIALSSLPTDFNRFTVSYIVNIASSQPPGIYNSTLTYIASATF